MSRQNYSLADLTAIIREGLGEQGADFEPTYESVSTLLDKIGLTISLQSNVVDHLEMFDDVVLSHGTTVEEYINEMLVVEDYDPTASPFDAEPVDVKRAYHTRSKDKKITLPVLKAEIDRAFTSPEGTASFTARQIARIDDTFKNYKYEAKKIAIGQKLLRDHATFNENTKKWETTGVSKWKDIISDAKTTTQGVGEKFLANITVEIGVDEDDNPILSHAIIDKATSEEFILAIQSLVEDMQFLRVGYNTFGIPQQTQKENLVLLLKSGALPIMNVRALSNVFNKELLGLGIDVKVVDDFGIDTSVLTSGDPLGKVYAILADKRLVRYITTRNEMGVDVIGASLKVVYTKHFGENVVTSDAVNYVAFTDHEEVDS
jgi:hypothetical protein